MMKSPVPRLVEDYDSDYDSESNAMDCRVESAKRVADTDAGGDQKRQKLSNPLMRTATVALAVPARQTLVVLGPTTPPPIQESTQDKLLKLLKIQRDQVNGSFQAAEGHNDSQYILSNPNATSEYIYDTQWADATKIVELFMTTNCLAVSVLKKTKVGADGLMLALVKLFATHPDDNFIVPLASIHIITAMSNAGWEEDMKAKAPCCLKDKIRHHGQLKKADFENLKNGLIIIDEMDVGNKKDQRMHKKLEGAHILDAEYLKANNIKLVLISATPLKELYDLHQWGALHQHVKMTIPDSYIGHKEFLEMGIIQEFYYLHTKEAAEKWVQEDVLGYKDDFRVHIVRVDAKSKSLSFLKNACELKSVVWKNHTSKDRLTPEQFKEYFQSPLTNHIVLFIKGLLRRANLITNTWKLRIGATHELKTSFIDYSVQIQGLPGRMTGYWRAAIEAGHKTGPHRTSIAAVKAYDNFHNNFFGPNTYQSAGFKMTNGKIITTTATIFSPELILNLESVALPGAAAAANPAASYRIYSNEKTTKAACKILGYRYISPEKKKTETGFYMTSLHLKQEVASLEKAIKRVPDAIKKGGPHNACRVYFPCYADTTNISTLKFVVIIRPTTDQAKVAECDAKFPHEIYAVASAGTAAAAAAT
jgi:hypothetical protein